MNRYDPTGLYDCSSRDDWNVVNVCEQVGGDDDTESYGGSGGGGEPGALEPGGGGGESKPLSIMLTRRSAYKDAIYANATGAFSGEIMDCLAGRESGWDPSLDNGQGFRGMFQIGDSGWQDVNDKTGVNHNYMKNVFDARVNTMYAAAYLEVLLKYQVGLDVYEKQKFTESDLQAVIERYNGSSIKKVFAQQVMDCAKAMKAGNINEALQKIGKN